MPAKARGHGGTSVFGGNSLPIFTIGFFKKKISTAVNKLVSYIIAMGTVVSQKDSLTEGNDESTGASCFCNNLANKADVLHFQEQAKSYNTIQYKSLHDVH